MATGYYSPKVTIHVEDGIKYVEKHTGEFDVIITDSSDPIGTQMSIIFVKNCNFPALNT